MSLDCPVGCEEATLSPKFNECTQTLHFGEIEEIAVAKNSFAGFTDVTDEDEWATHISAGDIEILVVKATVEEPDREEIESTKGNTIYGKPTFTVPFEIHDLTSENLAMVKNSYCNGKFKVWLRSATLVHGGNSGYSNASFKMNVAHTQGTNTLVKIMGSVKFIALTQEVAVIGSSIS